MALRCSSRVGALPPEPFRMTLEPLVGPPGHHSIVRQSARRGPAGPASTSGFHPTCIGERWRLAFADSKVVWTGLGNGGTHYPRVICPGAAHEGQRLL